MSSKARIHRNDKAPSKQRPSQSPIRAVALITTKQRPPAAIIRQARIDPNSLTRRDILQLQRTIGNRAVSQLLMAGIQARSTRGRLQGESLNIQGKQNPIDHDLSRIPTYPTVPKTIQTKLAINEPGDKYEQEADRVAEQVMRMPDSVVVGASLQSSKGRGSGQRTSIPQRSVLPVSLRPPRISSFTGSMAARLSGLRGRGQPLPQSVRGFFEPRFRREFSDTRIHTDHWAAETARAVNARAFTFGRNIVFGAGQFEPGTPEGRRLLAHELTHVAQQRAARSVAIQRQIKKFGHHAEPTLSLLSLIPAYYRMGEIAPAVCDLQNRLNYYFSGPGNPPPLKIDGLFGPKTFRSVILFQKLNYPHPPAWAWGVVEQITWNNLSLLQGIPQQDPLPQGTAAPRCFDHCGYILDVWDRGNISSLLPPSRIFIPLHVAGSAVGLELINRQAASARVEVRIQGPNGLIDSSVRVPGNKSYFRVFESQECTPVSWYISISSNVGAVDWIVSQNWRHPPRPCCS